MDKNSLEYIISAARSQSTVNLATFKELLSIQSISTDATYSENVREAAEWVNTLLVEVGMRRCDIIETDGHPMVCAEWLSADPGSPTAVLYAHYDVQPADPLDLWQSPPFDPTVRDGKLCARGYHSEIRLGL